jgi:hypothetical protein
MSNVVNIVELQNVVTSVTGQGDIGQLTADVTNIKKMVNFDTKTIYTNVISRYDQSPIVVRDPVSFLSSIIVTGSISLNGITIAAISQPGVDVFENSTGNVVVYSNSTSTTSYTNTLRVPNKSTVIVAADLVPDKTLSYNLGSPDAYWDSLYVGTGTIHLGPTGTIGFSSNSVKVGPSLITDNISTNSVITGKLNLAYNNSTIGIYVDNNGLQIQQPNGSTGILGATGPTGAVIYSAYVFDAGNAFTNYESYSFPAFDCGGAT